MADLTELGVAAIRDGVARGDFTAVEVAEAFNANVAAAQAALNAFIVATPEKAVEAAKAVDAVQMTARHVMSRTRRRVNRLHVPSP